MLQDMAEEEEPGDIFMEMPSEEPDEDIETQLSATEEFEQAGFDTTQEPVSTMEEEPAYDMGEDDLGSLLDSLGADGDEDAQEISNLLDKAERNEPIDDMVDSLMQGLGQGVPSDELRSGEDFTGDGAVEELLDGSKKRKKKKKERVKKERVKKEKNPAATRRSRKRRNLLRMHRRRPTICQRRTLKHCCRRLGVFLWMNLRRKKRSKVFGASF